MAYCPEKQCLAVGCWDASLSLVHVSQAGRLGAPRNLNDGSSGFCVTDTRGDPVRGGAKQTGDPVALDWVTWCAFTPGTCTLAATFLNGPHDNNAVTYTPSRSFS